MYVCMYVSKIKLHIYTHFVDKRNKFKFKIIRMKPS